MPKLTHKKKRFLGDVLAIRRTALGFSINSLAKELNCSRMTVHNWEIGKYEPAPQWIVKLSKVLRMKPEKFILGASDGKAK